MVGKCLARRSCAPCSKGRTPESSFGTPPPKDPTVGLCLGPCGGPRGWMFSYKRGTRVEQQWKEESFPRRASAVRRRVHAKSQPGHICE